MAVEISYQRTTSLNEKPIVSDLLGTLFELVFSLIVVLNSVLSNVSILYGILITIVLIITFSTISGFNKLLSPNLFFREISFLISYIFLLILIPSHSSILLLTFILFAFGNSVLGVCRSKQICNKLLFRNFDAGLIIFVSISFLVIFIFLLNNHLYLVKEKDNGIFYRIFDFSENVLMISVVAAIVNNFKNKVLRNFLFPVITALLLFLSFSNGNNIITGNLEIAFAASILISVISYKLKFLTAEGAQYQFILAFLILGLGGWKWAIPISVFFITSSLLSGIKTNSKNKAELFFEKNGIRDSMQVLANGGLGGLLVMLNALYSSELFYLAYVSSLAVVCSDTWSTEIGTLLKTKTISIKNFKETEQGTSGGISFPGSIGAVMGAFIIPISSLFWLDSILLISISGILGNIVDSLLGAVVQAQYKCSVCGKITERKYHCSNRAILLKGKKWLNNDAVNFISAFSGALFLVILKEIIKA